MTYKKDENKESRIEFKVRNELKPDEMMQRNDKSYKREANNQSKNLVQLALSKAFELRGDKSHDLGSSHENRRDE